MQKTQIISYDKRVQLFWALVTISILSILIYIYAVNVIARNIALKQHLEKQIADMSANFDSLEFAYIELRNNVTLELAYQRGFKEVKSPLYVSRARPQALSFNTSSR